MPYTYEAMRREIADLVGAAVHVTIDDGALADVAVVMRQQLATGGTAFQTDPQRFPAESPAENSRDTLQFYLVLTSQEFCIWRRRPDGAVEAWEITIGGERFVGARGIAAAHMRALRRGQPILDARYLAAMTLDDVRNIYRDERTGQVTLQLLPQRLAKYNELGRVLLERYDGHAANLLEAADGYLFRGDDQGLIQRLLLDFPTAYFDWPFCKLAMLYPKFLSTRAVDGIPTTPGYRRLVRIRDPEHFEIAADYYIPLFFIRTGIFRISADLADRLREQRLIARDSRMEREYRAATVTAGRRLATTTHAAVNAVDTECWRMGYLGCRPCRVGVSDAEHPCAYRGVSRAFQREHALMELRWPLVLTTCY
ncbi:MAG: queuosine salvage family protein [Armatimonadota bacterium]|nr:queuosine salvage family protein [Armatimonadota bacterium]